MLPLKDGRILAIGGAHDAECCLTENSYIREIEFYDPSTQLWNIAGELPQPSHPFSSRANTGWPGVGHWR